MMSDDTTPVPATMQPTPWRRVGLFVCLAASAGTGLGLLLEYTGQKTFPGSIEARRTVVTASRAARIQEVSVKTGQSVAVGDPLIQLIDTQLEDRLNRKRRDLAELEAEVARSKAIAEVELSWRRRELQSEIFETQLKVAALSQEKLNKQVEQIAWKERLSAGDSGIGPLLAETDHPFRPISASLTQPDDRRLQAMLREDAAAAAVEAIGTQVALCEQRLKKLEELDQDLNGKIRASSGVDVAETRFNSAKEELTALEAQVKELTITSPSYGTIGEIKLQEGDRVNASSTLVEILDDQQPHVVAQIPSHATAQARQGSKVTLIFPTNDRRSGVITGIPPQTVPVAGTTETVLQTKIEPAGKLWPKMAVGSNVKVLLQ
ncbi:HlyD family secretion protein [Schlesneria paludicola]|uniref:HlyD family secretion protein n=1 Tax=Schlesneria paludicola TaxID=360056 RepID=UPI00030F3CFA|nr:HlyD family efflux transporter periplasmic adaptor subunit [Schlesneria paludicola]